jgi:hypothetical protein
LKDEAPAFREGDDGFHELGGFRCGRRGHKGRI